LKKTIQIIIKNDKLTRFNSTETQDYQVINKLDAYAGPSIGFSVQHGATVAAGMELRLNGVHS